MKSISNRRRQVAYVYDEDFRRYSKYEVNPGNFIPGVRRTKFITPLDIQAVNMFYSGH